MVREQLVDAGLTDRRVLMAMEQVPRHRFVPKVLRHRAHQPSALPIGYGQTISRPFTVGLMTTLLRLEGGENVLEIGTGSGYQAAVLACLAASVVSVERVRPLAKRARVILGELGITNVDALPADGTIGLPERAPFDAIMVTACAPHLPPALLGQLREGGHLLIPVSRGREQTLYRYQRRGEEVVVEQSMSCRFVPLRNGLEDPVENSAAAAAEAGGEHLA